jgi:hypothetical protein
MIVDIIHYSNIVCCVKSHVTAEFCLRLTSRNVSLWVGLPALNRQAKMRVASSLVVPAVATLSQTSCLKRWLTLWVESLLLMFACFRMLIWEQHHSLLHVLQSEAFKVLGAGPPIQGANGTFNYLIKLILDVPATRQMYLRRLRSIMDLYLNGYVRLNCHPC